MLCKVRPAPWNQIELLERIFSFGSKDEPVFLGRDFTQRADYSEDTAIRIDREVNRIVDGAYERAKSILTEHRDVLERLALELLEQESLDGERVYELVREMTGQDLTPVRRLPKPQDEPTSEAESEDAEVETSQEAGASKSTDDVGVAAAHRSPSADALPSTD